VTCLTNIYHPNIDPTEHYENVCLNILNDWPPSYGLQDCIQGILFLLYNPNLADPLSPYFDDFYDEEEFAKNVRMSLRGESVEGVTFDTRRAPTAAGTVTSTEREVDVTRDRGGFFSEQNQEDNFGLKNLFADQKQFCIEVDSAEDTDDDEDVLPDRKHEETVVEVNTKQEDTNGVEHTLTDDDTDVIMAGDITVHQVHHAAEWNTCRDLIVVPSSRVMLHRSPDKGLVCRHSRQTVIGLHVLRKLLNVATTCVRFSLSHVHRHPRRVRLVTNASLR